MARLPIFLALAVVSAFAAAGDYLSKVWADGKGNQHTVYAAIACYCACTCLWFPVLKYGKHLGRLTGMWVIVTMLAGILMGVFVFHERLSSINILGVGLGILGIILISI
jgi:multidrug transporter EmrE-like cation transporter